MHGKFTDHATKYYFVEIDVSDGSDHLFVIRILGENFSLFPHIIYTLFLQ